MSKDLLFQHLYDSPEYGNDLAEKTIDHIKILDLRYTEEIDIIFMTSHYAKIKYGKKFNANDGSQILSIIATCFNYGGIIDKEGDILLTEDLTKKFNEQATKFEENSVISNKPNEIENTSEKETKVTSNQYERRNEQLNLFNLFDDIRGDREDSLTDELSINLSKSTEDGTTGAVLPTKRGESHQSKELSSGPGDELPTSGGDDLGRDDDRFLRRTSKFHTPRENKNNYVITENNQTFQGNRFAYNLMVLESLLQIEQEGRDATDDEKALLAGYSGFGGIANILYDENSYSFRRLDTSTQARIKDLQAVVKRLDPDGSKNIIDLIKASTLTAYYTPVNIVRGIYDVLERITYSGGTILEPAIGTGIFMGTLPQKFKQNSKLYGVEKDYITARIAQLLYPDTRIQHKGLETASLPNNYFDLIVGNIPFGDSRVHDANWNKNSNPIYKAAQHRVHNYFVIKMLELARPGAIISFITSSATLDTPGNKFVRSYIFSHAEFLGAIRLHNKAFKETDTEVTSDIIFLRKFLEKEAIKQSIEFLETLEQTLQYKDSGQLIEVSYNRYFHDHPEMLIGIPKAGGLYKAEAFTLFPPQYELNLREEIKKRGEAIISQEIQIGNKQEAVLVQKRNSPVEYTAKDYFDVRPGNIIVQNGKLGIIMQDYNEHFERILVLKEMSKSIPIYQGEDFIQLRTILYRLMRAELEDQPEAKIEKERQALNLKYDSYVRRYGRLRDKKSRFIESDIDSFTMFALEKYDKAGHYIGKADVFSQRTINPKVTISKASSPQEAVLITLNEYGKLEKSRLSELLGADWETLTQDIVFEIPDSPGEYETKERYLSGNVKQKLVQAKAAAELDDRFSHNVTMLEGVIPQDIPASLVTMNLGTRWIPEEDYSTFVRTLFEIPQYDETGGKVFYNHVGDIFHIERYQGYNENIKTRYAASGKDGMEIAEAALNDIQIKIYYKNEAGESIFDFKGTQAVEEKISKIKDEFFKWLTKDQERFQKLGKRYNDLFNTDVLTHYDGSHLTFPGLKGIELRPHQKDATWMLLQNQGGMVDHMVGAGKTLVALSTAIKLRQTGLAKKVLYIALKPTVPEIALEFRRVYPLAKVLAPTETDFTTKNRKKILAQIALGDWDCIILSHEQYGRLEHASWVEQQVIQEEIDLLTATVAGIGIKNKQTELDKKQLKSLQKRKINLQAKLESVLNRKTDEFCFEKLGIDHLLVDESHIFKNLAYSTSHHQVAGLGDPAGSQRATFLLLGCRALQTLHGGDKGITFLSGTPISNSMVELYLILRYLRPNKLKEMGLVTFDAWASVFAKRSSEIEFSVTGELKMKERFREFVNVPEMAMMYAAIADVRNDKNLELPKPKLQFNLIDIEPSDRQQWYMKKIVSFAQNGFSSALKLSGDNVKKAKYLLATTLSAKVSMDIRLLDPNNPDETSSKIHKAALYITQTYHKTDTYKGVQLVYSDLGTPSEKFNVYDELKRKLIEEHGLPGDKIAYIHDASSEKLKLDLFNKVRNGDIRVLIGSTSKLGTGVNVQDRIISMHHLDIPWTPTQFRQRNGRGGRQGNWLAPRINNNIIPVNVYALQRSLDAYKYQLLQTKQNFIDQVRDGSIKDRTFDEGADGENTMPFAEFIAILSGNPLILEKANVDKEIKKLYTSQRIFEEEKYYNKVKISNLKSTITRVKEETENTEKDMVYFRENGFGKSPEGSYNYNVTIDGIPYTKPSDAGTIILSHVEKGKLGKVLEGYGVDLYLTKSMSLTGNVVNYSILHAPSGYIYGNKNLSADATHAGLSIISAIEQAQRVLEKKKDLPDMIKGLELLEQTQNNEWEHLSKLESLLQQQKEITQKLEAIGKEKKCDVSDETEEKKEMDKNIGLKNIKSYHMSPERKEVFKDGLITVSETSLINSDQIIWLAEVKRVSREEYLKIILPLVEINKGAWNSSLRAILFNDKEVVKIFNQSLHEKFGSISKSSIPVQSIVKIQDQEINSITSQLQGNKRDPKRHLKI